MQVMRYEVALPADYDMDVIRHRVSERGGYTDELEGLTFKAYLISDQARTGQANAYAPFYLWHSSCALARFVLGAPFASLTAAFGRPKVEQALLCCFEPGAAHTADPLCATLSDELIPPAADLAMVRERERAQARERARDPATHSVLVAVDPARWKLTRLALRVDPVEAHHGADQRLFEVARLSRPALAGG